MIRIQADAPLRATPGRVELTPAERRHLEVRRVEAGAEVEVLDGWGNVGRGPLGVSGRTAWVDLREVRHVAAPPALSLLVGAGDRDRFLWLAEKAQELGVTRLVPVLTRRAANVATRIRAEHLEKLYRRAAEAMKQSGNPWMMAVYEPAELPRVLEGITAPVRWLADPGGEAPAPSGAGETAVLVGPEGGLTEEERTLAVEAGFVPVRLGPYALRFETAALAAASLITALRKESR